MTSISTVFLSDAVRSPQPINDPIFSWSPQTQTHRVKGGRMICGVDLALSSNKHIPLPSGKETGLSFSPHNGSEIMNQGTQFNISEQQEF